MDKGRIKYLDSARALAMIWVVGIWHNQLLDNNCYVFRYITFGVLSVFMFMSGYLTRPIVSAKAYFLHKLIKLYPLFVLSCVSLFALHLMDSSFGYITSVPQLLLSLFGFTCFTRNLPLTIWFFCVIILFYMLTPLLMKYKWPFAGLIYLVFILGAVFFTFDERLVIYFPFYVIGLIGKPIYKKWESIRLPIRLSIICVGVTGSLILLHRTENIPSTMICGLFGCVAILETAKMLAAASDRLASGFYIIAYASTIAYLFHRQVYSAIGFVLKKMPMPDFARHIFMFILVVLISYFAQKLYDKMVLTFRLLRTGSASA